MRSQWNETLLVIFGMILGCVMTVSGLVSVFGIAGGWTIGSLAEWISGIGTIGAIAAGIWQLKRQTLQQRQWATLQVCDRYDNDPVLTDAKKLIREVHFEPQSARADHNVRSACRTLFNYFDSIAIGLEQGLYIDDIVESHLRTIIIDWYKFLP